MIWYLIIDKFIEQIKCRFCCNFKKDMGIFTSRGAVTIFVCIYSSIPYMPVINWIEIEVLVLVVPRSSYSDQISGVWITWITICSSMILYISSIRGTFSWAIITPNLHYSGSNHIICFILPNPITPIQNRKNAIFYW